MDFLDRRVGMECLTRAAFQTLYVSRRAHPAYPKYFAFYLSIRPNPAGSFAECHLLVKSSYHTRCESFDSPSYCLFADLTYWRLWLQSFATATAVLSLLVLAEAATALASAKLVGMRLRTPAEQTFRFASAANYPNQVHLRRSVSLASED